MDLGGELGSAQLTQRRGRAVTHDEHAAGADVVSGGCYRHGLLRDQRGAKLRFRLPTAAALLSTVTELSAAGSSLATELGATAKTTTAAAGPAASGLPGLWQGGLDEAGGRGSTATATFAS